MFRDKFIEPYHPNQNPFKLDWGRCTSDIKKLIINCNMDPQGWFCLMVHNTDLNNHSTNYLNEDNIPPNTTAKE